MLPEIKITLRVNNQITVTRQRLARKSEPFYYSPENENHSHKSVNDIKTRYAQLNGIDSYWDSKTRSVVLIRESSQKPVIDTIRALLALDITNKFQRDKQDSRKQKDGLKRGYGLPPRVKNFGAKAGQKIRECGAAIDLLSNGEPSKSRVITLTLPSSETSSYKAISDWSGYATNRLLQIIRRTRDEQFYWFYCVEHQKRGALHWHICLFHPNKEKSSQLGDAIVSKWEDILRDIGGRCDLDLLYSKGFGRSITTSEMQCLNQEMHKGCGAYFSKYAAKTSHGRESRKVEDINTINARRYPPSSFWGRSHNLVRMCNENSFLYKFDGIDDSDSVSIRGKAFELLSQFDIKITHSFSFKKQIEHCNGTLTICEGESEVFYLSPEDYKEAIGLFRSEFGKSPSSRIPERAKRGGYLSQTEQEIGYF